MNNHLRNFPYLVDEERENRHNLAQYIHACDDCGEETLIGIDYRQDAYRDDDYMQSDKICTDCKTQYLNTKRWFNGKR